MRRTLIHVLPNARERGRGERVAVLVRGGMIGESRSWRETGPALLAGLTAETGLELSDLA
ncbi:hypothetical protein [Streptosporangium sp. 'caverna']|uniref:hypothetical protein n=1 Tax=Streptosporangium sp. 'caverna' TaxID=2202249 RepID=UPI0013A693F2|nr:hypothetical protein [Streptosporangium sp. 'caverna']